MKRRLEGGLSRSRGAGDLQKDPAWCDCVDTKALRQQPCAECISGRGIGTVELSDLGRSEPVMKERGGAVLLISQALLKGSLRRRWSNEHDLQVQHCFRRNRTRIIRGNPPNGGRWPATGTEAGDKVCAAAGGCASSGVTSVLAIAAASPRSVPAILFRDLSMSRPSARCNVRRTDPNEISSWPNNIRRREFQMSISLPSASRSREESRPGSQGRFSRQRETADPQHSACDAARYPCKGYVPLPF